MKGALQFALICLYACLIFICLSAPTVNYFQAQFEYATETRKSVFFDATLDPGSTLTYSNCSGSGTAAISPCCANNPSSNCFNPSNTQCIDTNPFSASATIESDVGATFLSYQFRVDNINCNSLFIGVNVKKGKLYTDVTVNNGATHLISKPIQGSIPICCSSLPQDGSWDRIITVTVMPIFFSTSQTTVDFDLQLFQSNANLPLPMFNNLVDVTMTFNSLNVYTCKGNVDGNEVCYWDFIPTNDTIYHTYKRTVSDSVTPYPERLFWEFVVYKNDAATDILTQVFDWNTLGPFTRDINPPSIVVTFNNLNPVIGLDVIAKKANITCTNTDIRKQEYLDVKSILDNPFPTNSLKANIPARFNHMITILEAQTQRVLAPVLSYSWIACDLLISERLLDSSYQNSTLTSTDCYYDIKDYNWQLDPCCNTDLLSDQCCIPKPVLNSIPSYSIPLTNKISNVCPSIGRSTDCVVGALNKYIASEDAWKQCSQTLEISPNDRSDILYDTCYKQLFGSTCKDDFICATEYNGYCAASPNRGAGLLNAISEENTRICYRTCNSSSDCLYGPCVDLGDRKICQISSSNDPFINPNWDNQISTCVANLLNNTHPLFKLTFLSRIGLNAQASVSDIATQIRTRVSSPDCSANIFPGAPHTSNCLSAQTCNWYHCDTQSSEFCSSTYCSPREDFRIFKSQYFCGIKPTSGPVYAEVSTQTGYCQYFPNYEYNDSAYCTEELNGTLFSTYLCENPDFTTCGAECSGANRIPLEEFRLYSYKESFPPGTKGHVCLPRCKIIGADISVCNARINEGALWDSIDNVCVLPATTRSVCEGYSQTTWGANSTIKWWPGAMVFYPAYGESGCNPYCKYNSALTQRQCTEGATAVHCSNPFCNTTNCHTNEAVCQASGYCTFFPGCYFPLNDNKTCNFNLIAAAFPNYEYNSLFDKVKWTPAGCIMQDQNGVPVNQATCVRHRGTYLSHAAWKSYDKDLCSRVTLEPICKLPEVKTSSVQSISDIWPGYSGVTRLECPSCGGTAVEPFTWIQGKILPNTANDWVNLQWVNRTMVPLYTNVSTIQRQDFLNFFSIVDLTFASSTISARLTCKYETKAQDSIPDISCLCSANNNTNASLCSCNTQDTLVPINAFAACSGFSDEFITIIDKSSVTTQIDTTFQLVSTTTSCTNIKVYKGNFTNLITTTLPIAIDAGRAYSTQGYNREFPGYILNKNNVIIARVIGSGVTFVSNDEVKLEQNRIKGLTNCFVLNEAFPKDFTENYGGYKYRGIAKAEVTSTNDSLSVSSRLFLVENLLLITEQGQELCIPVERNMMYYPIAIVGSPEELTYSDTINRSDYGAVIGAIVVWLIMLTITIFLVLVDIKKNKKKFRTFLKPAGIFLIPAYALRVAYGGWLLNDPPLDSHISVLFIELPCMLIWNLACLNLVRWLQGKNDEGCGCNVSCCIPKLRPFVWLLVAVNAALFIAYLVIVVADLGSGITDPPQVVNATQQIASFVWYAFFLSFGFIALIWYALAGVIGVCGACESVFGEETKQSSLAKRSIALSLIIVILVTIGQVIILTSVFLWRRVTGTILEDWTLTGWMVAFILSDTIPVLPLLYVCMSSPQFHGLFGGSN